MTRRGAPDYAVDSTAIAMTVRTGLTLNQVKIGFALMRTGRSDLIAKVIAGEMTAAATLAAARRRVS